MQLREGVELAEAALRIEEEGDGEMEARACLFVGIGYQMKAQASRGPRPPAPSAAGRV